MNNIIKSALPVLSDGEEYRITSPFGYRVDPVTGKGNGAHEGTDLVLWRGTWSDVSNIGAAWDGRVIAVLDTVDGFSSVQSAGNYVIIDHGGGWVSKYFHLAFGTIAVSVGEAVAAGRMIGRMGSTGYSTGAHLHFQLEQNGMPVDPLPYLTGEADIRAKAPWYAEDLKWLTDNGILKGDPDGNLRLDDTSTRIETGVMMRRLYELIMSKLGGSKQ